MKIHPPNYFQVTQTLPMVLWYYYSFTWAVFSWPPSKKGDKKLFYIKIIPRSDKVKCSITGNFCHFLKFKRKIHFLTISKVFKMLNCESHQREKAIVPYLFSDICHLIQISYFTQKHLSLGFCIETLNIEVKWRSYSAWIEQKNNKNIVTWLIRAIPKWGWQGTQILLGWGPLWTLSEITKYQCWRPHDQAFPTKCLVLFTKIPRKKLPITNM